MKVKYYEDADLLSIEISSKPFVEGRQNGDFIVHLDQDGEPVLIEILNAAKFLRDGNKLLPKRVVKSLGSNFKQLPAIPHRIKR